MAVVVTISNVEQIYQCLFAYFETKRSHTEACNLSTLIARELGNVLLHETLLSAREETTLAYAKAIFPDGNNAFWVSAAYVKARRDRKRG